MKTDIKVKKVKIEELKENPINPKKHFDEGIETSLDQLGYLDPIEVDEDMVILAGHGRLRALKKAKVKQVPVIIHSGLTKKQKKQYLLANNQLTMREGWVDSVLKDKFNVDDLLAAGFDEKKVNQLFKNDTGDDDFDAEAAHAAVKKPKAKRGDIFILGNHRIMCGDATDPKDMKKLMGTEKANMVFVDPPYNVNYSGRGKNTKQKIMNDDMTEEEFRTMLDHSFGNLADFSRKNAPLYTCYASRTHREFEDALNKAGYKVKNQIIWVKAVASMGWGDYRWKHEPLLYCSLDESPPFYGDRSQYTEWKEEMTDPQLLRHVRKLIEREEQGESSVWRLKREVKYDHPTQKPLQLLRIALWNSSKINDIVLDTFLGGGSTLLAAEETDRVCYGMELDPKWIDTIIKRWEKATGKKAEKLST